MLTGFYVYFITGGPEKYSWNLTERPKAFDITVEEYGSCELQHRCISYRVGSEGSVTLLQFTQEGDPQRIDQRLDAKALSTFKQLIKQTDFLVLEERYARVCDTNRESETYYKLMVTTQDYTHTLYECPDNSLRNDTELFTLLDTSVAALGLES